MPETPVPPRNVAQKLRRPLIAGLRAHAVAGSSHARLVGFAAATVLAAITIAVLARWDVPLFVWIQSHLGNAFDPEWSALTLLGSGVAIVAVLSPIWRWRPQLGASILLSGALCTVAVQVIKRLAVEPRPLAMLGSDVVHVVGIPLYGKSFPSGHAAAAFACAAFLIVSGCVGARLRIVIIAAAAAIAFSRVAVGAHWPTDLLAGAIIGWICGVAGHRLAERLPAAVQHHLEWIAGLTLFVCGFALVVVDLGYPLARGFQHFLGIVCMAVTGITLLERVFVSGRGIRT